MAVPFWALALALFVLPFLRERSGPDPEGDDPGRAVSEIDYTFEQDLAALREDLELDLAEVVPAASEEHFGPDSELVRSGRIVDGSRLDAGRRAYETHCIGCHGSVGDGGGAAATHLDPRPRNFRRGVFKFTSTPTGERPLRRDLFTTITRGLSGSSMPEFRLLSEEVRWDLVEYVRYVAMRGEFEQMMVDVAWDDEEIPDAAELAGIVVERWDPRALKAVHPPVPETANDEESVARGRALFLDAAKANCVACHGPEGKGDGPSAGDFKDDWGYPIVPRDLTRGIFRAGAEPSDLYRSIATGINGTPMGSFSGSLSPEEIWDLVHFVQSLAEVR